MQNGLVESFSVVQPKCEDMMTRPGDIDSNGRLRSFRMRKSAFRRFPCKTTRISCFNMAKEKPCNRPQGLPRENLLVAQIGVVKAHAAHSLHRALQVSLAAEWADSNDLHRPG